MLIDLNQVPENSQIDCDICIAGAGPAGITIAAELVDVPVRVCLVESGGLSPRAAVPAGNVAEQLGVLVDLIKVQHLSFGGASNRWGGLRGRWFRLRPMDPLDFETRPWVANSGWPFEYARLAPFYARAGRILKISAGSDFSAVARHAHLTPAFHNDDLRTAIFLMTRPLRFGQHYLELLTRSPNIRVYLHGTLVEIEEDPDSPIVRRIHVATPDGRTHRISAKHFVLACGGFENTRLLLASKRKMACGIGNQRDLVGRYYMQHPTGLHGAAVLDPKHLRTPLYTGGYVANGMRISGGISFSEEFQRRQQVLNHCIMLRPLFAISEGYASQAYRSVQRAWYRAERHPGRRGELRDLARSAAAVLKQALEGSGLRTIVGVLNHMEQIPKPESRLDLSERKDRFGVNQLRIDWRIDPQEKASLCRLHKLVQERLAAHGLGKLESRLDPFADDWPVSQDSAHHLGTTRMHADPAYGVTDSDCRVHGVRNLYISGGSLFPTSGHANPTLTIVALTVRLADHLKRLYGAAQV
jgi:choline dehydrogenase-like flavoprotein